MTGTELLGGLCACPSDAAQKTHPTLCLAKCFHITGTWGKPSLLKLPLLRQTL